MTHQASVVSAAPTLIREIMTSDPITVTPSTTARTLARILDIDEISGVPVVDGQYRVIGVVSKTDLLHRIVQGTDSNRGDFFLALADDLLEGEIDPNELGMVEDFMNSDPITCAPTDSIPVVAHQMADAHIHRIIVVDENQHLLGIISTTDLLRALADSHESGDS